MTPEAPSAPILHLLCAGAAQGLVQALQARFAAATGAVVQGRFGAVGAMKEALLAGASCDVLVLTDAMVTALAAAGQLRAETRAPLGTVRTGIAVRAGATPLPDVATPAALKAALAAADAIYFPDAVRSTAGSHFAKVLQQLGLHDTLAPRCRTFPNGATAMRELAASTEAHAIGCTQVTEIRYTPGVQLVAPLPPAFELATVYAAAVSANAADAALAMQFVALLTGTQSQALRVQGGFDV